MFDKILDDFSRKVINFSKDKASEFVDKMGKNAIEAVSSRQEILMQIIDQYNNNQITKEEYQSYLGDIKKLWEMEKLKANEMMKSDLNSLISDFTELFINIIKTI